LKRAIFKAKRQGGNGGMLAARRRHGPEISNQKSRKTGRDFPTHLKRGRFLAQDIEKGMQFQFGRLRALLKTILKRGGGDFLIQKMEREERTAQRKREQMLVTR
jgi:hypothetical protein